MRYCSTIFLPWHRFTLFTPCPSVLRWCVCTFRFVCSHFIVLSLDRLHQISVTCIRRAILLGLFIISIPALLFRHKFLVLQLFGQLFRNFFELTPQLFIFLTQFLQYLLALCILLPFSLVRIERA